MCIIRIIKAGDVSSEEIKTLWKENPHGGGIALIDNDLNLKTDRHKIQLPDLELRLPIKYSIGI